MDLLSFPAIALAVALAAASPFGPGRLGGHGNVVTAINQFGRLHHMKNEITRRQFLKSAAATASVVLLNQGCVCPVRNRARNVRRDIGCLRSGDSIISSYRTAIKAMRALPTNDPLSWDYQAAIHGTTLMPMLTAWNSCEHGTYFFWSWHRMYLYWFERIIRKMSGDSSWSLPYWNWTSKRERQLPAMFRDTASELYTPNRDPAMNDGTGSLPASDVDYSSSFILTDFTNASLTIQGTPHGAVHVDVGGWMGSVPTAAQDPIFYLHHSNVDRLWDLWLAQGGGRSDPVNDSTWTGRKFIFFDENRRQIQMTGCEVLRAAQQLDYTYECEPAQVYQYCQGPFTIPPVYLETVLIHFPVPPELTSEPVSVQVNLTDVRDRLMELTRSKLGKIILNLEKVEADKQPGAVWEVYLGLPAGTTPDPKGPYYAGNVALFGAGVRSDAHEGFEPARFSFVVNRAISAALKSRGNQMSLMFVPHGILINGKPSRPKVQSPVRIGAANIAARTVSK